MSSRFIKWFWRFYYVFSCYSCEVCKGCIKFKRANIFVLLKGAFHCVRYIVVCLQVYCHFKSPLTTLEELDMVDADFTVDVIALIVIFLVLRVFAFVFLRWKLLSTR